MDERFPITAHSGQPGWVPVCGLSRLRTEAIVCARVCGIDLIVVWNDGDAIACERACPHEQADLSLGRVTGGRLFCPRHAASFDLRDGRISHGWPSRPLRLYPVRIAEGQVSIDAQSIGASVR
ncbi:Rieske (2Fe-2S) protein [Bradyrhizobium sp. BRP22]|uniref:Rieske (2Fe-2S) protein n=1 Tax=Bradyrhizobium sp. BRP22 TaxID=2793821 RepID=UPI001CD1E9DD